MLNNKITELEMYAIAVMTIKVTGNGAVWQITYDYLQVLDNGHQGHSRSLVISLVEVITNSITDNKYSSLVKSI